jgi:hypothetical protein
MRFGSDFVLKSHTKSYINGEIFLDYIRIIFLLNFAELRTLDECAEEIEMLLMDNFPSHVTDNVIHFITEVPVRVIIFALHTTQIFQVLDVTFFSVLKRRPRYELPFDDQKATIKFIMKVYHDFKQTMVKPNIRGAFQAI